MEYMFKMLEELLADRPEVQKSSLHQWTHFVRDRLMENMNDLMIDTNMGRFLLPAGVLNEDGEGTVQFWQQQDACPEVGDGARVFGGYVDADGIDITLWEITLRYPQAGVRL